MAELNAITREEKFLAKAAGEDVETPEPITRKEKFLAKAAGQNVETPEPITREEMFLSKIIGGNTPGGGGGAGDSASVLDGFITRTIKEVESNAEMVGASAFYECSQLTTADFPNATSIGKNAFYQCSQLKTADFPEVTTVGTNAFNGCSNLTTVSLPNATYFSPSAFYECSQLKTADFPKLTNYTANTFYGCSALVSCIVRSNTKCELANKNAFSNTPIEKGTGYIYVPSSLVDSYKSATNWSTYAAQFRALESYTVDGTTTGALDPNKI